MTIFGAEVLPVLISAHVSSLSIILVAITFLLSKYEDVKHVEPDRNPYERAIKILNYSLFLASLSILSAGLAYFDVYKSIEYFVSVVLLGLEISLIGGATVYISHKSLQNGLFE